MTAVNLLRSYLPKPVPPLLSVEDRAAKYAALPLPSAILQDFFGDNPADGSITVPLLGERVGRITPNLNAESLTPANTPQALRALMALLAEGHREICAGGSPPETEGVISRSLPGTDGHWSVSFRRPNPALQAPRLSYCSSDGWQAEVRQPAEIEFQGPSGRFVGWGTNNGFPIHTIGLKMGWRLGRSMSVAHSIQIDLESPLALFNETYWFEFGPSEDWGADPLREFLDMGPGAPIQCVALRLGAAILASGQFDAVRASQDLRLGGDRAWRKFVETGAGRFDYPPGFRYDLSHNIQSRMRNRWEEPRCRISGVSAASDTLTLSLAAQDIGEEPSFILAPLFRDLRDFMKGLIEEASLKKAA